MGPVLEIVAQPRQVRKEAAVSDWSLSTSGSRVAGVFHFQADRRIGVLISTLGHGECDCRIFNDNAVRHLFRNARLLHNRQKLIRQGGVRLELAAPGFSDMVPAGVVR